MYIRVVCIFSFSTCQELANDDYLEIFLVGHTVPTHDHSDNVQPGAKWRRTSQWTSLGDDGKKMEETFSFDTART